MRNLARAVALGGICLFCRIGEATPPLAQPNWSTGSTGIQKHSIDPQIAAGQNRVVVTEYDEVYFYTKAGVRITNVDNDATKPPLPYTLKEIFKPYWDPAASWNLNDVLDLPSDSHCYRTNANADSVYVTIGGVQKLNYCITRFYDARVLYDAYRDRFVIVAVAFNEASKCKFSNEEANLNARRTKMVVAYSKSADPTDGSGWTLGWFDAVPGESCTDSACRTFWGYTRGDGADYPSIAITPNHLLVSISNHTKPTTGGCIDTDDDTDDDDGVYPDKTASLHVWSAAALSSGNYDTTTCSGICSWVYYNGGTHSDLKYASGGNVTGWVVPANTHGSSYLGHAWFGMPESDNQLRVWHFDDGPRTTAPTLYHGNATIPKFDSVDRGSVKMSYPQPATSTTSSPGKLALTYTKSLVMQDQYLYYADVGGMGSGSSPDASIRVAGMIPSGTGNSVAYALNRNAIFHVAGEGYGSPALEVDEARTIVLAYSKFGKSSSDPTSLVGFGARYLTWTAGDSAAPSGRALATNENSLDYDSSKWDTAGIALAPGGRVYMMQPYVNASAGWSFAVNFIDP